MSYEIYSDEYKAIKQERANLIIEKKDIESKLGNRNVTTNGQRVDGKVYWINRQKTIDRKTVIERRLIEIKEWIRNNHKPPHVVNVPDRKPGTLDEHDLENALIEPVQLLQLAYSTLQKLTAQRFGITESDRAILDSIRDYLRRRGTLVT